MAHTRTWDKTVPAGTALANTLDTVIQNMKADVTERLSTEHRWLNGTGSDNAGDGKHRFSTERVRELAAVTRTAGDSNATVTHTIKLLDDATAVAPDWVTFRFEGAAQVALDGTSLDAKEYPCPQMDREAFIHVTNITTTELTLEFGRIGLGIICVSGEPKIVYASDVVVISHYILSEGTVIT